MMYPMEIKAGCVCGNHARECFCTDEYENACPPDSERTRDADHYLEQWKEDKLREKEDF